MDPGNINRRYLSIKNTVVKDTKKTLLKIGTITLITLLAFSIGYVVKDYQAHRDPVITANVHITENIGGVSAEISSGNLITDIGESFVQSWLGLSGAANTTSRNATQYISLSNDASPNASWTQHDTEINANNFTRATGTVAAWQNSGDYAFNVTYLFTATGTQQLQCAGLHWSGGPVSDNNMFAVATFTQTTFNTDDTLTVTWSITVDAN